MFSLFLLLAPLLVQPKELPVYHMDEVVVTATRVKTKLQNLSSSVTVITRKDIDKQHATTVSELLRDVPGVDVIQTSGPGSQTSVFIRGAEVRHALVLINGIQVNDPSLPDAGFDFAHITTNDIERIEIVRGGLSTLYGSDAIGGVINIITKKEGAQTYFTEGIGSRETYNGGFGSFVKANRLSCSFGAHGNMTNGISHAREGEESDNYRNLSFYSQITFDLLKNIKLEALSSHMSTKADLDRYDWMLGQLVDDALFYETTNMSLISLNLVHSIASFWGHKLSYSLYSNEREDHHPFYSNLETSYKGGRNAINWQHTLSLKPIIVIGGFEYKKEQYSGEFEKSVNNKAFYLEGLVSLKNLFPSLGIRCDEHEEFGRAGTWKFGLAYMLSTLTKFKINYSNDFKAPSIYQLYAPPVPEWWFLGGNSKLNPEKSKGYDIGMEQTGLNKKIYISITWFNRKYEDLITYYTDPFTGQSTYRNIGKAESKGIEAEFRIDLKNLSLKANYTNQSAINAATKENLLRRPANKWNFGFNHSIGKFKSNLQINWVDRRMDYGNIELRPYTKVDISCSYQVVKGFELFGSIKNLLNQRYEEVHGYNTLPISFYIGINSKISLK
ncbi:TonB-dependent receptor [candidate division WOR-3 bacterium]|nr:TonB-dependent receptor [candidate division WOR-3 bacterium]